MANVKRKTNSAGTALVEAAIVFPILLTFTLGAMEYGWLFLKAQQTDNAARNASRKAVRPDATEAEIRSSVATLMAAAGLGSSGYTVQLAPSNVATVPVGEPLTVSITVPYKKCSLIGGSFLPLPTNLFASATMAKEGP